MTRHQLHPLQVNAQTGEVYLRLPAPLDNFIITPTRESDVPNMMMLMNDPLVHPWLTNPPYPYSRADGEWWVGRIMPLQQTVLQTLQEHEGKEPILVEGCPVDIIREVKPDGTDTFAGSIAGIRCSWMEYSKGATQEDKARLEEANNKLALGDPNIIWTLGDSLLSTYHGRGIMTAATATIMRDWMIPRMGVRRMLATAFVGNIGSVRVLEKNGFKLRETRENCVVVKGEIRGIHALEWEYEDK